MKKTIVLLVVVILVSSLFSACGGSSVNGKLLIFDTIPDQKLLAISPVSPAGKVSELPIDPATMWTERTTSPDGKTLVFGKAIYGELGNLAEYSLIIYRAQDLSLPIIMDIPIDVLHRLDTYSVNIHPVWKQGKMFIVIVWGQYDLALYSVDINHGTLKLVKTVSFPDNIREQINDSLGISVLPDLSQVVIYRGVYNRQGTFGLYDVETQKLTVFDAIGRPAYSPDWSPDGKHLAYVTQMGDGTACLIKVSINGTDIQSQTVFCPELSALATEHLEVFTSGIDWSPDGKHLALRIWGFFRSEVDFWQHVYKYLYLVDSVSSETVTLDVDPAFGTAWSPDSKKLAYMVYSDDKTEVFTVNANGSERSLIYSSELDVNTTFNANIAGWLK